MRKVIVTFNIIWDYHTRLPKMFWYVTACKNINLGIYNKQIRFYAPRTSLETMSDVLNLCIKNKCPKNHDWAFIFHNWELKLKIEYFMVLKLQITQNFLFLLSRGSGPLCSHTKGYSVWQYLQNEALNKMGYSPLPSHTMSIRIFWIIYVILCNRFMTLLTLTLLLYLYKIALLSGKKSFGEN